MAKKIVLIIFSILSLSASAFGILYLVHRGIMPYHLSFFGTSIEELNKFNPRILELAVALMRVCGGACLAIGIGAGFVIYNVRNYISMRWVWLLFIQFFVVLSCLASVTLYVASKIPNGESKPPYILTLILLGLDIIALIISLQIVKKDKLKGKLMDQ